MPVTGIEQLHASLQLAARERRLDDLFEMLHASGSLVVFNHPLVPWGKEPGRMIPPRPAAAPLRWAIHARGVHTECAARKENDRVLELARYAGKASRRRCDSHLLLASSVLSLTPRHELQGFAEEVKGAAPSL